MIIYRDAEREVDGREAVDSCVAVLRAAAADHDAATSALIEWGEIAASLADALSPLQDDISPTLEALHAAGMSVARVSRATSLRDAPAARANALFAVQAVQALTERMPARLTLRVPEGFAHYALYPETYVSAAAAFARETGTGQATVIGLRSIGATLGSVVAATLEAQGWEVRSLTLRPRGHPFERRPMLSPALSAWFAGRPGVFLVVDEGPGLSGSSLCGTAEGLAALGVADDRIVLMPSWLPDPETFVSEPARARWRRHRKLVTSFEEVVAPSVLPPGGRDISAGVWRELVLGDRAAWPAVHPQHERRKSLHDGEGRSLIKFAGLGRYGAAKHALGERLAAAGLVPPVLGLAQGFLRSAFVTARPLSRRDLGRDLVAFAAGYLGQRVVLSPMRERVRVDELMSMAETNIRLGLGEDWLAPLATLQRLRPLLEDAPAVAVDGRVQPHEWLRTPTGFLKADAVDHHYDHFFPGPADIAWDIAGFAAEFALSDAQAREFAHHAGLSKDLGLGDRLPFYAVAYLAFRLGYAAMAGRSLGSIPDGRRFARLRRRYAWQLRHALLSMES